MARCEYCGNIVPDGQASCPVCGAKMTGPANGGYQNGGAGNQQYTNQQYYNQTYNNQAYNNQNYTNQGYANQNQGYANPNQGYANQGYNNTYQNQQSTMDGADYTYMYDPMDIANNKVMAVLSYLGILCLIPLLANHDSRYARFHTAQGVNLLVINIIIGVVRGTTGIFGGFGLVTLCCSLFSLATFIFMILGIVNAATGRAKELPVIGKLHILSLF